MTAITKSDEKLKCDNVKVTRKRVRRCADCLQSFSKTKTPFLFKFTLRKLFGLVLGILALVTTHLNETRAIDFSIHYNKVMNKVAEVDSNRFSPEHEGKLIYLHGRLQVDEPLTEPEYGVSVQAVKLRQRVQMFQWVEKIVDNQLNYEGEWKHKLVDSTKFLRNETHRNPHSFPLESKLYVSEGARVGEYYISQEYKDTLKDFVQITSDERPENRNIKMHFGLYYHSDNVWKPDIGDVRVQFAYAGLHEEPISVVGKVVGRTVHPYYNITNGYHIEYIHPGPKVSLQDLLDTGHRKSIWTIRMFRVISTTLFFLFSHFVLPRRRDGAMTSLIVSISLTSIVTSYVWYWYYPAFSGNLLLTAILCPLILSFILGWWKCSKR